MQWGFDIYREPSRAIKNFVKWEEVFKGEAGEEKWKDIWGLFLSRLTPEAKEYLGNEYMAYYDILNVALEGVRLNALKPERVTAMSKLYLLKWTSWYSRQVELVQISNEKFFTDNATSEMTGSNTGQSETKSDDYLYNQEKIKNNPNPGDYQLETALDTGSGIKNNNNSQSEANTIASRTKYNTKEIADLMNNATNPSSVLINNLVSYLLCPLQDEAFKGMW